MKSVVMNMYGTFNMCLWVMFIMATCGTLGEPISAWFFIIPFLFSFMYAGAVYKVLGER